MKELIMKGPLSNQDIETLLAFARDNGGIDYAYSRMREMQTNAIGLLSCYPDSHWKQSLIDILEFTISRSI